MTAGLSGRALIVEDEPSISALVARTLAEAGIESDTAFTGLDGLWMAREASYGVMILDLLLPGMSGIEVCATLRAEQNPIPILMLTAKTGVDDETDGLDIGADDYLRKPFSPSVLTSRVKALLRRTPTVRASEVLCRGQISFDITARLCRVRDEPVSLTAKEALLLETLLRGGDEPLSRYLILQQVWGMDFDGDPNIVDVYVGYLRRKLGKEQVETVRGSGFRIAT